MSDRSGLRTESERTSVPLSTRRLKEGQSCELWVASEIERGIIVGCWTKFQKGGSIFVPEDEAVQLLNGKQVIWKGFIFALEWIKPEKRFLPCVFEVSERLEQDFRDRICRGQVWKISRAPHVAKKIQANRGELVSSSKTDGLPRAIDFLPYLRNVLFRNPGVCLTVPNPLPPIPLVSYVDAPADSGEQQAKINRMTPEQRQRLDQMLRIGGGSNGKA